MESQYLGAQVIYQKVRLEFDGSDPQTLAFRDLLFEQVRIHL